LGGVQVGATVDGAVGAKIGSKGDDIEWSAGVTYRPGDVRVGINAKRRF